ncbi:hypothetical protein KBA63_00015 [Candidatus Woesebacteria bacterium]|nr:hypothetical protein [Candidatus Woesebacteria bacterium]
MDEKAFDYAKFLKLTNHMQLLGYQAAKMVRPDLEQEEFIRSTAAVFRGIIMGEIYVAEVDWLNVREEVKTLMAKT